MKLLNLKTKHFKANFYKPLIYFEVHCKGIFFYQKEYMINEITNNLELERIIIYYKNMKIKYDYDFKLKIILKNETKIPIQNLLHT